MASLRFVGHAVIDPIGIRVPCEPIADVDVDAIAVEVHAKIGCIFGILMDYLSGGHIAGEWP
jgi:hypothetical protein